MNATRVHRERHFSPCKPVDPTAAHRVMFLTWSVLIKMKMADIFAGGRSRRYRHPRGRSPTRTIYPLWTSVLRWTRWLVIRALPIHRSRSASHFAAHTCIVLPAQRNLLVGKQDGKAAADHDGPLATKREKSHETTRILTLVQFLRRVSTAREHRKGQGRGRCHPCDR